MGLLAQKSIPGARSWRARGMCARSAMPALVPVRALIGRALHSCRVVLTKARDDALAAINAFDVSSLPLHCML